MSARLPKTVIKFGQSFSNFVVPKTTSSLKQRLKPFKVIMPGTDYSIGSDDSLSDILKTNSDSANIDVIGGLGKPSATENSSLEQLWPADMFKRDVSMIPDLVLQSNLFASAGGLGATSYIFDFLQGIRVQALKGQREFNICAHSRGAWMAIEAIRMIYENGGLYLNESTFLPASDFIFSASLFDPVAMTIRSLATPYSLPPFKRVDLYVGYRQGYIGNLLYRYFLNGYRQDKNTQVVCNLAPVNHGGTVNNQNEYSKMFGLMLKDSFGINEFDEVARCKQIIEIESKSYDNNWTKNYSKQRILCTTGASSTLGLLPPQIDWGVLNYLATLYPNLGNYLMDLKNGADTKFEPIQKEIMTMSSMELKFTQHLCRYMFLYGIFNNTNKSFFAFVFNRLAQQTCELSNNCYPLEIKYDKLDKLDSVLGMQIQKISKK